MSSPSSTTLRDAKKPLHLKITTADIKKSKRNDPKHCMIAESCIRSVNATEVRIHKSRAYVKVGDTWTRYIVPAFAARELIVFDRGGESFEFEFDLKPPTALKKLGADVRERKEGSRTRGQQHRPQIITDHVRTSMEKGTGLHIALGV